MPLQSVFTASIDEELGRKRQLHVRQQREILQWIKSQQDRKGHGFESLWHEFAHRHFVFMECSEIDDDKFLSNAPQFRLKHQYYEKGYEDWSTLVEHAVTDSLNDIELSLFDGDTSASSDNSSDDTHTSGGGAAQVLSPLDRSVPEPSSSIATVAGTDTSFDFQPQSTSSRPTSPGFPSSSAVHDESLIFSSAPIPRNFVLPSSAGLEEALVDDSQLEQALIGMSLSTNENPPAAHGASSHSQASHPPPTDQHHSEADRAMPGLLNISFALGEMSKSAVWSDVKTSIAQRMKLSLQELEIATEVRIPDNMGIVRWLSAAGAEPLGACFPLLVTELKPLGVTALQPAGARVIQKTLHQVSWQAALAMEMFGECNVWTLICAGQWACFQYWTADGMKPIPNGPLPSKEDAGEADETSDVIPIYEETHTDFSDAYKAWMDRVIRTARAATLTDERVKRQRQALSQFV